MASSNGNGSASSHLRANRLPSPVGSSGGSSSSAPGYATIPLEDYAGHLELPLLSVHKSSLGGLKSKRVRIYLLPIVGIVIIVVLFTLTAPKPRPSNQFAEYHSLGTAPLGAGGIAGTGVDRDVEGMLKAPEVEEEEWRSDVVYTDEYFQAALEDVSKLAFVSPTAPSPESLLPLCERTLLVDWASFADNGVGRTYMSILQATYWAEQNDYEVLVARGSNHYGKYLDFFVPPKRECRVTEDMFHVGHCSETVSCDGIDASFEPLIREEQLETSQYHFSWQHSRILDDFLHSHYLIPSPFSSPASPSSVPTPLPTSLSPLSFSQAIPPVLRPAFNAFAALSARHFAFNPDLSARVQWAEWELITRLGEKTGDEDIRIGVLYKTSDGLEMTCEMEAACANITLHTEAAYESYLAIARSRTVIDRIPRPKPKMVLFTLEPGAYERFEKDKLGRMFEIVEMPTHIVKGSLTEELARQELPYDAVIATSITIASLEVLALHVDAAIVNAGTHLGRITMLRGGEARFKAGVKVRPVDRGWDARLD